MIPKITSISYNQHFGKANQTNNSQKKTIITSAIVGAVSSAAIMFAVSKYENIKMAKQVGEILLEKPKIFTQEMLDNIVDKWFDDGLIYSKDKVVVVSISTLKNMTKKDKKYQDILNHMKTTENSFAVAVVDENQEFDMETIKYFDPECNTILKLVDAIKSGCIYQCKL